MVTNRAAAHRPAGRSLRRRGIAGLLAALLVVGCAPGPASSGATGVAAVSSAVSRVVPSPVSQPASDSSVPLSAVLPAQTARPLAGRTIVVDPGHNGRYSTSFNTKKVPAGNGKKKACNSSGTAGRGLSEHAYNWAQAKLLRTELERLGATVLLTRKNDSGLGPCVNLRAKLANDAKADLMISIHADGSHSRKARGFHIIISKAMAGGSKLEKRSRQLALHARTALGRLTKMPRSTYIGRGTALSPRSDIATLNLLKRTPGIMLEMGNMRHSKDLKLMKSATFRKQAAKALAEAAVKTLAP